MSYLNIFFSLDRPSSRQSSIESEAAASRRPSLVKQNSVDSVEATSKHPTVTKQSSADDWLGLGDEKPIQTTSPVPKKPAAKVSTSKPPGMFVMFYINLCYMITIRFKLNLNSVRSQVMNVMAMVCWLVLCFTLYQIHIG